MCHSSHCVHHLWHITACLFFSSSWNAISGWIFNGDIRYTAFLYHKVCVYEIIFSILYYWWTFEAVCFIRDLVVHYHEPECCVTIILNCCAQGQGHSEGSIPQGICNLSWQYLLKYLTFLNETWYFGVSSWPGVSWKRFGFLSSRSRSQCRLKS